MGLTSKTGNMPSLKGEMKGVVPTPTFSGKTDAVDASVSINPNTGVGPGPGGTGVTTAEYDVLITQIPLTQTNTSPHHIQNQLTNNQTNKRKQK